MTGNEPAQEKCVKCHRWFDDADRRFWWSGRRYRDTPFCCACVDQCHDSDIADHWCAVDRWRAEQQPAR